MLDTQQDIGEGDVMTILLVDSDKKALDREMRRFTQRPFAVTVSLHSSANDAIRFFMCHDVDMVFTRVVLADMTGRELVEKIHQINRKWSVISFLQTKRSRSVGFLGCPKNFLDSGSVQLQPLEKKIETGDTDMMEISRLKASGCSFQTEREEGDRSMTEQELRSLNRKELLEIMIEQGRGAGNQQGEI